MEKLKHKIRWGVIGAGGIADKRTIPGMLLAKNAVLAAIMDTHKETALRIGEKYEVSAVYSDLDDILGDPGLDAVYISSPVYCHQEQCIKAARAGKHILVEKPIALTADEGIEILEVCNKNGVLIGVGLMMRFSSTHKKIKQEVQKGTIGEVISCNAQFSCYYPPGPGRWRQSRSLGGGGSFIDMGIHAVDLICNIIDSRIKTVLGHAMNRYFDYETEDTAVALMTHQNSCITTIHSHFNIPDNAARSTLDIYGTKGSIRASGTLGQIDEGDVLFLYESSQKELIYEPVNMYTEEIEAFGDSILKGKEIIVPAFDAIHAQIVTEALYLSSKNGKRVDIKEEREYK